jgi:POT family proton-dependent oligopeptide transporter
MNEKPSSVAPNSRFGHPRGISTLFFTEMWERMSFYGMRALLILYMTRHMAEGGMGLSKEIAGAIYGLYTSAVYLGALPGGWIADRLLGQQRSIFIGGIIIAAGHFTMAIPDSRAFFLGLVLIVFGTSLLKPNASVIVGELYPEGGARRDAGYTLFYMGINLGAFLGPLVCGWLGEKWNWHYGFAAAGIGMMAGVIQYGLTRHQLRTAGLHPPHPSKSSVRDWTVVVTGVAAVFLVAVLAMQGSIVLDAELMARYAAVVILGVAVVWFLWAFTLAGLDRAERKRLVVFLSSALFWSGFEQAGSSMNLFAESHTDRTVGDWLAPAGWFQSANALFVLLLAPLVSALWIALGRRGRSPSVVSKMAWGLIMLGGGFYVMHWAAARSVVSSTSFILVSPWWLISTYLLHTFGELFLSPVGLSAVSKLAPARLAGQTMGIWFLATSFGNLMAGLLSGTITGGSAAHMPSQFLGLSEIASGAGLVLLLCSPLIRRLAPAIE